MADRPTGGAVGAAGAVAPEGPAQVQSVDRALTVLELLARHGEAGVTELAADLGVHKSTAFRLVAALERRRLVEQVGDRGKYRLGLGVLRLAAATTGRLDVAREGRDVAARLARTLGETVNIAILDDGAAVNVLQEYGPAAIGSRNWIGRRTPLHATSSGKVLLAHADADLRREVLAGPLEALTAATVTDPAELAGQLDTAVRCGWAATHEELEVGLTAVAAPVWDGAGRVVAAISVSGPTYRLNSEILDGVTRRLVEGSEEVSARLGHHR